MKATGISVSMLVFMLIPATLKAEFKHPGLFLDSSEIQEILTRVEAGEQPWKQAHDALMQAAAGALGQKNLSVTYQGSTGNDYYTEQPYCGWTTARSPCGSSCCDGKINPQADRADYQAVADLSRSVRNLGLAFAFTGEARYADKAIALLRNWFLHPTSRMNPKITNNQSQIELYISMPGVFYGADLIWNHSGWLPNEREGFQKWVGTFMEDVKVRSHGTNYENWRLVLLSSGAFMSGDSALLHSAFDIWKTRIADQMNSKGEMIKELDRTKSLDYSTYAVNAMVQTAEIARHQGVDLYNYRLPDGRGLELTLDFHAPFILNPSRWIHPQIDTYKGDNAAVYELAYAIWQKDAYHAVIQKSGRPLNEIRTLGLTTLTHAFGAHATSIQDAILQAPIPATDENSQVPLRDLNGRQLPQGARPTGGIFVNPEAKRTQEKIISKPLSE